MLKVTKVTAGASLILSTTRGSGSVGITYTDRYGFGATTTLVRIGF